MTFDTIVIGSGQKVDDHYRTSAKGVYAVGDCAGGPQFTHTAAGAPDPTLQPRPRPAWTPSGARG